MIEEILFKQEPLIRAGFFFGMLGLMGLWERLFPTRQPVVSKPLRWASNLGMVMLSTLLLRAVFPLAAVGFAGIAASRGWGVFNILNLPGWLVILLSIMILDLIIYLQHVMFHALPVLWRLHRVHHADRDFDTTTGLRFHPIEIFLSMGIKMSAIALIGAPPGKFCGKLTQNTARSAIWFDLKAKIKMPGPHYYCRTPDRQLC